MDFLVGSVRRHLTPSRTKSQSLPLYAKGPFGLGPSRTGEDEQVSEQESPISLLQKRVSLSSPKLSPPPPPQGQERRGSFFKRRNSSSSCLPSPGRGSDSDSSPSDTTSCSSMEFLPGSSFQVSDTAQGQPDPQVARGTPGTRRVRLDALKARVTAQRNKYKDESSSSSEEEKDCAETEALSLFHSDEALHRSARGRNSRKVKRRSQDMEIMASTQVSRSDPQLPCDNRPPSVTWQESNAYLEPHNQCTTQNHTRSASADISTPSFLRKRSPSPILNSQCLTKHPFLGVGAASRKPLTVNIHGPAGHYQPASPCDSGLGSQSVASSPSLGRAPTPPLRSPKLEGHRLPPSLNSTPGMNNNVSADTWWQKKQSLLSQMTPARTDVASPRLVSRVYAYTDQAPRPSAYLSDSQVDPGRMHSDEFSRKLGAWKAKESASSATENNVHVPVQKRSLPHDVKDTSNKKDQEEDKLLTDVCRSRSVVWPKSFSNGVSRSPTFDSSPCNSPLVWNRKENHSRLSPVPARALTPSSVHSNSSPTTESTPKTSPIPPRLWSPPVQPQSPNRTSAAEALGISAAVPVPPTRVGSLDTARRSVDNLVERERRRRCSEHLEDALQELETIYQSLRLNDDEELLDRAERRDVPAWRTESDKRWQKRYSIADPTGGFPLARSFSEQSARLRRSTVPDKVADDLAVRKWQQRSSPTPRNRLPVEKSISPTYMLCSPAYTPSLSVQPATLDITCSSEADPELDDVGYRKFVQSQRQPPPHPPFGIPLEPSSGSPASSYIYAEATDEAEGPDWRNSKKNVEADPHRDDLAYRNFRRESLLRPGCRRSISAFSDLEDWTRPLTPTKTTTGESMASIIAALEDLGQKSPPPVPKRRSVPCSGQNRLHGLTFRA